VVIEERAHLSSTKSNLSVCTTVYSEVPQTRAFGRGQSTHLALASWRYTLAAALHEPALGSVLVMTGLRRRLLESRVSARFLRRARTRSRLCAFIDWPPASTLRVS
jgi:hypothetical protein